MKSKIRKNTEWTVFFDAVTIIADIIACYLDPDLRKMIFGVVIGGIIPLFFIPILEKFVVKSKQSFLDETKDEINRS